MSDRTFQMRLCHDEYDKLINLAEKANTDKSSFVKRMVFSEDRIIILDNARLISRSLIEISDQLRGARRDGKLSDELFNQTYAKLCEVSVAFATLSMELTIFRGTPDEGGGD